MTDQIILIDKNKILQAINFINVKIDVFSSIDSTNIYLQQKKSLDRYHVCLTEHQKKGKARFNREWHSPFGQNIYFSIKTKLKIHLSELSGLSLAMAVITIKTLLTLYHPKFIPSIKWPNDIHVFRKKLSGNLIEITKSNFQNEVIIGIGLNVNMKYTCNIDQPWISLCQITGSNIDRNSIIIQLITNVITGLKKFEKSGFREFISEYRDYDCLINKTITLKILGRNLLTGICQGINKMGQLSILHAGKLHYFSSGEASIKN